MVVVNTENVVTLPTYIYIDDDLYNIYHPLVIIPIAVLFFLRLRYFLDLAALFIYYCLDRPHIIRVFTSYVYIFVYSHCIIYFAHIVVWFLLLLSTVTSQWFELNLFRLYNTRIINK